MKIKIIQKDNSIIDANLVTFLISEDYNDRYLVYSKGEKHGESDNIIYISKIEKNDNNNFYLKEIVDNIEWNKVQHLLKRIANA